jgi:hypothetical protein
MDVLMNKLLFLGCNNNQIPYLLEAKKLGYFIVGTDTNKHAPGKKYADKFFQASYEDREALIAIVKKENFTKKDKVFTAASQFAYIGASQFADFFKIKYPKPENIDICLDKIKLYKFLESNNIPIPPTKYINSQETLEKNIKSNQTYFLKSDWSKNPNYIYQLKRGNINNINWQKDRYLRKGYVLQSKIEGNHYRINLWKNNYFIFYKITDKFSFPIKIIGKEHLKIINKLFKITKLLSLNDFLVKFDLIIDQSKYYLIDIGIDPPMRLKLWLESMNISFPYFYLKHYLFKKPEYPIPQTINPVLIINKGKDYIVKKL